MEKNLLRRIANRILAFSARLAPGATSLRPMLHRLRGVKIQGRVFIGDDVYLENEYPEAIELENGAQIAVRSVLIAHTRGAGQIVIAEDAFLGANCVVTAPVGRTLRIGKGAVVAAGSIVSSDIPDYALVGPPRAVPLARVSRPLTLQTSYEEFAMGLRPWKEGPASGEDKRAAAGLICDRSVRESGREHPEVVGGTSAPAEQSRSQSDAYFEHQLSALENSHRQLPDAPSPASPSRLA